MPIYLKPPEHDPRGPDGKGWNRLSLNAHMGPASPQCALQPTSYETLVESQDTRRARFGPYGRCALQGACERCPVALAGPVEMPERIQRVDRVLFRILPGTDELREMASDDPAHGHEGWSWPWTWTGLRRVDGWRVGRRFVDEHGDGFWLTRSAVAHAHAGHRSARMSDYWQGDRVDIAIHNAQVVGYGHHGGEFQSDFIMVALPVGEAEQDVRIHLSGSAVTVARTTDPSPQDRLAEQISRARDVDLIRKAISDPGAIVERECINGVYESLPAWSARAVVRALHGPEAP